MRRVYTGHRPDSDTLYLMYKLHTEKERDKLLQHNNVLPHRITWNAIFM